MNNNILFKDYLKKYTDINNKFIDDFLVFMMLEQLIMIM